MDYKEGSSYAEFKTGTVHITGTDGAVRTSPSIASKTDWYDEQKLGLTNATIFWKSIAPRPVSNVYTTDRGGKGDGMHVVHLKRTTTRIILQTIHNMSMQDIMHRMHQTLIGVLLQEQLDSQEQLVYQFQQAMDFGVKTHKTLHSLL